MELQYLNEFIALVEIGNYLEAADSLYLSQSTLSRHVQSIENDLGVQLFTRTTRKVELNEFGRIFLPYAKKIAGLKEDYTEALSREIRFQKTDITIGAIPTMAQYHITEILSRFQAEHPDFHLNIVDADSSELEKLLRDGLCDFVFIRTHEKLGPEVSVYPYFTDHVVAIFPVGHPLASSETVSLDQLKAESFLLLSKGSMMHRLVTRACKSAGFSPHVAFTGCRAENIIDLVGRGMGIGLLTRQPLGCIDTQNVRIVDIVPQFTTNIVLACRSEASLGPTARQFLKFYKSLGIS